MQSVNEKQRNPKGAGRPIRMSLQYYTVNDAFMQYPKAQIRRLYPDVKLPHISLLEAQGIFMEIVKYGLLNTGFYTDFSEAGRHILYENIIKLSSDDISKDNFVALVGLFVSFGIFDSELYDTHQVLSCKEMQEHYFTIKAQITRGFNGYLHIGHAKSICLNFGVALEAGVIRRRTFSPKLIFLSLTRRPRFLVVTHAFGVTAVHFWSKTSAHQMERSF